MMPFIAAFATFVIQDSMLWLNRELGLGLTFLADWYGYEYGNTQIIRRMDTPFQIICVNL